MHDPNEQSDTRQCERQPLAALPKNTDLFSDEADASGLPAEQHNQDSVILTPEQSIQPRPEGQDFRANTAGGELNHFNPFPGEEVSMHNPNERLEANQSQRERQSFTTGPETTPLFRGEPAEPELEQASVESNRTIDRTKADRAELLPLAKWEEGQVYICRQGRLEHIQRDPDEMRKVRMTETAYQATLELGKTLRKSLHGYKPDVALVVSALVIAAGRDPEAAGTAIRQYVRELFQETR